MYKEKWYLETWFIAIMFSLSIFILPFIAGVVLLILQIIENERIVNKYAKADQLDEVINAKKNQVSFIENDFMNKAQNLENEYIIKTQQYQEDISNLQANYTKEEAALQKQFNDLRQELEERYSTEEIALQRKFNDLQQELEASYSKEKVNLSIKKTSLIQDLDDLNAEYELLKRETLVEHYKLSEYDAYSSEECKNQLALLKTDLQELIKNSEAVNIFSYGSRKEVNDNVKQIIRCFNTECDNILYNVNAKNIDLMRNKMTKSFETLNKIFHVDGVELTRAFLEYKLNELNLIYTYEIKKEQEKEVQRAIKEQMLEEEKVRREIEKQKAKIEKDQQQCSGEINKLTSYLQKTENDAEKQLYIDKIRELEEQIKSLEAEKENVLEREANAKAGYVYVISNIGSFGDDVYKIGMTRRLEPLDRVKELSSASVPFEFDVHAMIFSNDAPALENNLHKHFERQSVNKVNFRKEFFKVNLDDIEAYVKENYNNTVIFTKIPAATEYRQTLQIIESGTY